MFKVLSIAAWVSFSQVQLRGWTERTADDINGFRTTASTLKLIQQDRKCTRMSGNVTLQRLIPQITHTRRWKICQTYLNNNWPFSDSLRELPEILSCCFCNIFWWFQCNKWDKKTTTLGVFNTTFGWLVWNQIIQMTMFTDLAAVYYVEISQSHDSLEVTFIIIIL